MAKNKTNANATVGSEDFDWSMYEDGWNGYSRKVNKSIKSPSNVKVYSHEKYAQELMNAFENITVPESKELRKHDLVSIDDITAIKGDKMLVSINKGSNNLIIDLNKEQRFFNILSMNDEKLTKETFAEYMKSEDFKKQVISMGLTAKIGTDVEKASLWDGYVEKLSNEMREQITKNSTVYLATILSANGGGFVVEVANTIKAFMPGSMAAANKIDNYDEFIGKTMEVMVESWNPKVGFVVSRKKYLKTITPIHTNELAKQIAEKPDTLYSGKITGTTPFGIFVEMTDVLTGMLHKTLISDELREQLRNNSIVAGTPISVYVHKIENGRIILSNVPSSEREAVIAKREAEDAKEKGEYVANKNSNGKGSNTRTNTKRQYNAKANADEKVAVSE